MRKVEIQDTDFQSFVWPAIAFLPVENGGEVDAHVRLLRKVKAVSEPTSEEKDGTIAGRSLTSDPTEFTFEEDEWGRLKKVLQKWLPKVAGGVLDRFQDLQNAINDAPQEDAS